MAFDAVTDIVSIRSIQDIDVENFKWETLPALNNHNGACSIIIDNYLYAIGGSLPTTGTSTYSTTCERINLDIIGASWENLPTFPVGMESAIALFNEDDDYLYIILGNVTGSGRDARVFKLQIKPHIGTSWEQTTTYEAGYRYADNRLYFYDKNSKYLFIPNGAQSNSSALDGLSGIYALNTQDGTYHYLGFPVAFNVRNSFCVVYDNYLYVGAGIYATTTTQINKIHRLNLDILNEVYINSNYLNNIVWEEYYTLPDTAHCFCFWLDSNYIYYIINPTTANASGYILKRFDIDNKFVDDLGVPNFPNSTELHVGGIAHKYKNYIYSLGVRNNSTDNYGVNAGYKLSIDNFEKHYGWNYTNNSIKASINIESSFSSNNSIIIDSLNTNLDSTGFSVKTVDGSAIDILTHRPTIASYTLVPNVQAPVMTSNTTPMGVVSASSSRAQTAEWGYAVSGDYFRAMMGQASGNLWESNGVAPQWLLYDYGYSFFPTTYRVGTVAADHDKNIIKSFILQGSTDGVTYIDLDTKVNLNLGRGSVYYFKLPVINNQYRYYRLYITEMKDTTNYPHVSNFSVFGYTPEDLANFRGDTLFTSLPISKDIQAIFPIVNFFATHNLISPFSLFAAQAIQEGMGPPGNYTLDKYAPLSSLVFNLTKDWTGYLNTNVATLEATLNSGEIFRSLINVPMSVLSGRIVFNIEFNSNITIPIATIDSTYYQDNIFTINVTLPTSYASSTLEDLSAAIQGALTDLITVVLNTKTLGHTTYTNYNFNTIVKFNNKYYGCDKTQGIFELTGDTDNNEQIDSTITTGISDYLIDEQKRVLDFYLNTRYDGSINIKTIADEVSEEVHTLDDSYKQGIHAERIKLSKGLRGKQWQINITNNNGSDFEIDKASILISKGSRRI